MFSIPPERLIDPMSEDATFRIVTLAAGFGGGFLLMIAPFTQRGRASSRWIRSALLIVGTVTLVWSALGFLLVFRGGEISAQARHTLSVTKTFLGGIAVGLLIALLLSPEFWTFARRRNV